ncbi:tyrosine-type recombinase/integrase, partial [Pseudomonas aeruginosa]|uniref:tyrosine-type recombinase/integrase n=1 Tax=Pseudomonas aeruginosa TaxID=287 RepID=UPI00265ED86A
FNRQLVRITGKGNKTRIVPFGKKAKESLLNWLKIYNIWKGHFDQNASVFISQRGGALTPRQIEKRVKLQAQKSGCKCRTYTHNLLRHCFASHMLSSSGDLIVNSFALQVKVIKPVLYRLGKRQKKAY